MTTFSQVYAALRRKNKGQYVLLAGCSFFSVLLITAYACMMRAPTILSVLPEGGDSRKQVMMVFVLAVIGCAVFTTYAAGLFFRQKSRETGVFLALGATRRQLQTELGKELALISLCSCAAGAILGGPLAWGIWQLFRLFLVDSQEMALAFDPEAYLLSFAFAAYVVVMLFLLGGRAIRRTNIIDIVQESHTSEPIREVKRWCGPVGIILVAVGALAGYLMPSFFIQVLRWYPPSVVDAVFYLPALVGMYMMLLHTVVNGWRKRHKYRDIIATSMMKFQGRQTVRNMLVMTLLIAGAYFAAFYAPMLSTNSAYSFASRPVDFEYHWRNDQGLPDQAEVEALAEEYNIDITSWQEVGAATLAGDGYVQVEQDNGALGTTYNVKYQEVASGATFFSESAWNALTGQNIDLAPGTCVFFNVADADASYPFAKALFNEIVDRSGDEVLQLDAYDLVAKTLAEEAGEPYDFDRENLTALGFPTMEREDRDSTEFRNYWLYMPQFRVLDQNDFVTTMAVFLMLFIFIALICFAAVIVIAFTRCMTIALTNRRVYDDLRHLGAPNAYLFRSVKGQVSKVFLVPAIVGTAIISAFYVMIMYFNDNRFTPGEIAGMGTCAAVIVLLSLVLYRVYQFTRKCVCHSLGI